MLDPLTLAYPLFGVPFVLMLVWSARYRVAIARADRFVEGPARLGDLLTAFIPMTPGQTLDLLRIEATARPEPQLEHLRRQLQS